MLEHWDYASAIFVRFKSSLYSHNLCKLNLRTVKKLTPLVPKFGLDATDLLIVLLKLREAVCTV